MLTPGKLTCEYFTNPIGIDSPAPRLSWRSTAEKRDARQTAFQICVGESPDALEASTAELSWNSGKVESADSLHVPYAGVPLKAGQRYFWRVRIWDENDTASSWSPVAYWETGLLGSGWQGSWITPDWDEDTSQSQPAPLLRRRFAKHGDLVAARIYVTGLGVYELKVNGQRVSDAVLTPGWTSYRWRVQYQTYDVTELIQEGVNVLGATLGDGWYRGYLGYTNQRNVYGDRLALLLQLHLTYRDGRIDVIGSDKLWRATTGPIRASDIYNGEIYDARLEKLGWCEPEYDDSGWYGVKSVNHPTKRIVAQVAPAIRRQEEIRPICILHSPKGETILDFGQNMVGWVRMRVRGPAGTAVTLRHAEVLDQDGNLYTENLRAAEQCTRYILRGRKDADEVFEPHFTFQGFRYVSVKGYPGEPSLDDFTGVVVHSELPITGRFECSNSLINQLQQNILWGQKGNFVDVPTDCPQRDERLGWTGDIQVFIRTACFNMDVAAFFTKWLRDLSADQLPGGSVPFVVPDVADRTSDNGSSVVKQAGAAAWSDAAVICPWTIYLCYGDTRLLAEQYDSMVGWVEFMRGRADEDLIWRHDSQFGDWLDYRGPDARRPMPVTNTELIATAFFAHSTQLLSQVARVLGKEDDADHYEALATNIKDAFYDEFVTPTGRVGPNTQTAYVLALHFDLLPQQIRPEAAARLVAEIRQGEYHLTTGFVGTPYLCHVLSRFGYADVAYKLLNQESYPSWLYPIKQGATTIWERWDGIKPDGSFQDASMNSFNHYAYGAIGDWLYQVVAGIELDPASPGYKRVLFQPQPGGSLTSAKAEIDSPYGLVRSSWTLEHDRFNLDMTLPANTEGVVHLPMNNLENITENGQALAQVSGIREIRREGDTAVLLVGSGNYQFSSPIRS